MPRRPGSAVILALVLVAGCSVQNPPSSPTPPGESVATPSGATSSIAAPSPSSSGDVSTQPIRWSDCGSGFQCGAIQVPRDEADPTGAVVRVTLIRLPAIDRARRIGSLVVNPGGPGISGVDFVRAGAAAVFPQAVRDRFDIVGFDPRGVNSSTPIRCTDDLDHFLAFDQTPDDPSELTALLTGTREFVAGCERRNGDLLPYVGTEEVVADLDRIRAALGDDRLTYVGFSYGTLIGALYADAHPDRVRALVLDGAVDPTLDLARFRSEQADAFEAAFDRFLAWCNGDPDCLFHGGADGRAAFDALMLAIEKEPLRALRIADRRLIGPSLAWSAVVGALYDRAAWPALAGALALAESGDGSLLLLLADPFNGRRPNGAFSNLVDANSAVICLDFPGPRDPTAFGALAADAAKSAPRFGALLVNVDLDCAFWPVAPIRQPGPVRAAGAPPILVVGTTGDPATPYAWAAALAGQLESGVLLTWEGEGHTAYGKSTCVDGAVDAYLLELKEPTDTTCR